MDKKVYELLNDQINKELYSAYLYMDFANYYEEEGLAGFANWYMIQAQEERDHAPLEAGLEHEKYVTSLINDIYSAAFAVNDYRTMKFLDWFIEEQGEEEDTAETMLTRMKLFGNDAKALYDLDQECAARVYTAPAA